jgi:hypothetical protein
VGVGIIGGLVSSQLATRSNKSYQATTGMAWQGSKTRLASTLQPPPPPSLDDDPWRRRRAGSTCRVTAQDVISMLVFYHEHNGFAKIKFLGLFRPCIILINLLNKVNMHP